MAKAKRKPAMKRKPRVKSTPKILKTRDHWPKSDWVFNWPKDGVKCKLPPPPPTVAKPDGPFDIYGSLSRRLASKAHAALDAEAAKVFRDSANAYTPLTGWPLYRCKLVNFWNRWKLVIHFGECPTEDY